MNLVEKFLVGVAYMKKIKHSGAYLLLALMVGFICMNSIPGRAQGSPQKMVPGSMDVVSGGQAKATIVVADNASEQLKLAAQTFQQYIYKSTGATLPIADSASGAAIHIGHTPYVVRQQLNLKSLDAEGYLIQSVDKNNLVIVGGSDWGTEFGVYSFLERFLGIRWLFPTELGESVPKHAEVSIPQIQLRQNPSYLSRYMSPLNAQAENPEGIWARRNRTKWRINFHHNLFRLFPPSKYAQTNPEFYSLIDGKRQIPAKDSDYKWQPNFSAPGLVDAAVKEIDAYFIANPDATSYSLGINDVIEFDQSPASKARRSGKKNYLGMEDVSDDYFLWANAVVEKVLEKHPDKVFGTLAYNNIAEPPTKVKVHPAIIPFITYERMRWEDPELRQFGEELTKKWAKASTTVAWYDYAYGISYLLPRVWFHRMQNYLAWGNKNNVKYHYAEVYPNFGTGPVTWIMAKLLWNPHQDVDKLLDDWYLHAAGKNAAPKLKQYFALWEKFWTQDIQRSKWNTKENQYLTFNADPAYLKDVPRGYVEQSDRFLAEALMLADTPEQKARVAKIVEMWKFYRASILVYQALQTPEINNEAEALAYIDTAVIAIDEGRIRRDLLAKFKDDPLYNMPHKYITLYPGTRGENWDRGILWKALPWARRSAAVQAKLQTIVQTGSPAVVEEALAMLPFTGKASRQLLSDPNFTRGIDEWGVKDKAVEEPNTYHRGKFSVFRPSETPDEKGLLIEGFQRGSLMQAVPYQPGKYYATVRYFLPENVPGWTVGWLIEILDDHGKVIQIPGGKVPTRSLPLIAGQQHSAAIPFELPAGVEQAKSMRILLFFNGMRPTSKFYLSEMALYLAG